MTAAKWNFAVWRLAELPATLRHFSQLRSAPNTVTQLCPERRSAVQPALQEARNAQPPNLLAGDAEPSPLLAGESWSGVAIDLATSC